MLHKFLVAHRTDLIDRCRAKVARRPAPKATPAELDHGIPLFLDQLVKALLVAQPPAVDTRRPNPFHLVGKGKESNGDKAPNDTEIEITATLHGLDLLKQGFTIDQVVHDYGDLCQAITELASETKSPITVDEFRTLNRCLDDAIASAVTEYAITHATAIASRSVQVSDERTRAMLHEMSTNVHTAELAITAIKAGNVGLKGATGAILDLSMVSMRSLIERSLPELADPVGKLARH